MDRSRPPIDVTAAPGGVRERLRGARTELDEGEVRRLRAVCGDVAADEASRVESSRDWWPISLRWALHGEVPALPAVVARPRSVAEIADVLRLCSAERIPVTVAAGRSGVCGGAVPLRGGVALDVGALAGVIDVDSTSLLIDVAAGTYGVDLEHTLRGEHAMTVGHWPQSVALSTVGGWIACRAAGQYSTRYGKIEDIVSGLQVVLANGTVVHTGSAADAGPRAAMGPDLTQVFVGSEGTLGVVTRARLRGHPVPPAERRAAWSFESVEEGMEALRRTLRRGATPAVLRLYDADEAQRNFNREDGALLVALDEGDAHIIDATMQVLGAECARAQPLGHEPVDHWYATRNDVSALGNVVRMGVVVDTVEVAASWRELPGLYRDAITALRALEGTVAASAHESHAYLDGACLYFTFAGLGADPQDDEWAERYYSAAWAAIMAATHTHRGSISHHHGVGIVRAAYLPGALGSGYAVLRALKSALDPGGILNPGKLGLAGPGEPS